MQDNITNMSSKFKNISIIAALKNMKQEKQKRCCLFSWSPSDMNLLLVKLNPTLSSPPDDLFKFC
jgi:hypothetical protein